MSSKNFFSSVTAKRSRLPSGACRNLALNPETD
jgi:hypothetical protein